MLLENVRICLTKTPKVLPVQNGRTEINAELKEDQKFQRNEFWTERQNFNLSLHVPMSVSGSFKLLTPLQLQTKIWL